MSPPAPSAPPAVNTASAAPEFALYTLALEQMGDAAVVVDADGVIRIWNRGAEVLFGFAPEEALGATLALLVPEKFWRAHDDGFRQAVATGHLKVAGRILTTRSNHKWGSRLYVDFTFALIKDGGGTVLGVIAVGRDATARHLEQVARRLQAHPA